MSRGRAGCAAMISMLVVGAAPAAAAPDWLPTTRTFSSATDDTGPPVSEFSRTGWGVMAWRSDAESGQEVRASVRRPGGDWTTPELVGAAQADTPTLDVAINDAGTAAVAVGRPGVDRVERSVGGGPFELVADDGGPAPEGMAVGVTGNGTVFDVEAGGGSVHFTQHSFGGSASEPLAASCALEDFDVSQAFEFAIALDCGNVQRVERWRPTPNTAGGLVRTATLAFTDTPAPENCGAFCTETREYDAPRVAISESGRLVGAVREVRVRNDTDKTTAILPVDAAPGQPASAPAELRRSAQTISDLGIDIQGSTVAYAWQEDVPAAFTPYGAVAGRGAPVALGPAESAETQPDVAASAAGDAMFAWRDIPGANFAVKARRWTAAGLAATRPLTSLTGSAGEPLVALDAAGNGLGTWRRFNTATFGNVVDARGFDAAPPALTGVSAPATTPLGVPAAFAASATDVWGPVSFRWAFGDGAGAATRTASHAYTRPGSYAAAVTATDAVGNVARAARTVTVPAARIALSNVTLRPRRIRRGRTAVLRFTLSAAGSVRLRTERKASGRRVRGRCRRPTRANRRARRCTRWVRVSSNTIRARKGETERRVGKRLRPGTYRLTLSAPDGPLARVTLKVRRPPRR